MESNIIYDILYGRCRPWIAEGLSSLQDGGAADLPGGRVEEEQNGIAWWMQADFPPPVDQYSLAYRAAVDRGINRMFEDIVQAIGQKQCAADRTFLFTNRMKELEDLLRESQRLCQSGPMSRGIITPGTILFILMDVRQHLLKLMLELGLRYGHLSLAHHYTVARIYPELLNQPPPDAAPFWRSLQWFRHELCRRLKDFARASSQGEEHLPAGSPALVTAELGREAMAQPGRYTVSEVQQLLHHTENALFLIISGAAFIKDRPEELADARFCREWVRSTKRGLMKAQADQDMITELEQLNAFFDRLGDLLKPVLPYFPQHEHSVAFAWSKQWKEAAMRIDAPAPAVDNTGGAERNDTDFVDYFNRRFIHKKDLERALGVGSKTIAGYLEDGDMSIRELKLKSNSWYLREDLEQFLDKKVD
jgi:hypothetical protein